MSRLDVFEHRLCNPFGVIGGPVWVTGRRRCVGVGHFAAAGLDDNVLSETKITVIYDNPADPDVFEAAYESEQLEAARRIPGYLRLEASKVWPKEDGSPTPAYHMIDLYYPDYDAVSTAVTTPEAGAFFAAMSRLATGGVRVLVSDVEVPQP